LMLLHYNIDLKACFDFASLLMGLHSSPCGFVTYRLFCVQPSFIHSDKLVDVRINHR
jgi:hypothetical protein